MRTLLRATIDATAGNKSITDGSLPGIIKETMDRLHPEATYFFTVDGNRSFMMVFDLKDPSEIPAIAEPLFNCMNAKVEFTPVMNADDLQKGLMAYRKSELAQTQ